MWKNKIEGMLLRSDDKELQNQRAETALFTMVERWAEKTFRGREEEEGNGNIKWRVCACSWMLIEGCGIKKINLPGDWKDTVKNDAQILKLRVWADAGAINS